MNGKKINTFSVFFQIICSFLLFSVLNLSVVYAISTTLCTDLQAIEKCYEDNPSFSNLALISDPTLEQFQLLEATDQQQAAMYLVVRYDTDFAEDYFSRIDLQYADPTQSLIAERFFSESPSHVQNYKSQFQTYMASQDVFIEILGDVASYDRDGTIIADNGKINVKQFRSEYSFIVNDDDEIILIPKDSKRQYTFEGTVTSNSQGDIRIMEDGAFDGMDVSNADYIRVDNDGNIVIGAEQYGDLKCKNFCHMIYNPNDMTYQLKDAVLVDYPDFQVAGTLRLDEQYLGLSTIYTLPTGKKLEVHPIVSDPKQQELSDQGYRVLANGGKDVQVALEDDTWLDHPIDFVFEYLKETAVSKGLVSKKNKVRFDSEGTVYLESTDAAEEDPTSYRMEVDMGAMYIAEQQEKQRASFIKMPDKGFYEKGDYADAGTEDAASITQIQNIVKTVPDGKYGKKTERAVLSWQNKYNKHYELTPDMQGYLIPDGIWKQDDTTAYLVMTNHFQETPALAIDMRGGEAVVDLQFSGIDITQTGAMDIEVEGVTFNYDAQGNTDKELQEVVKNEISIPITITSCNHAVSESSAVVGSVISPAVSGANCYKFRSTETSYGLDSLSKGFTEGKIAASCPLHLEMYDPSSASCASHVTALAEIEGGRYRIYGSEDLDFATYTGQIGSAWEMSYNVRAAGGETLYWKEADGVLPVSDPQLATPVTYDQSKIETGDLIGFYYKKSKYLDQAARAGDDDRKNTHVGKVVAKPHAVYTYTGNPTSASIYIQQQLDVDDFYLNGYPVWINFKRAKYDDGEYYYVDAQGNLKGTALTLQQGDRVDVQKTLINHLYHNSDNPNAAPTRLEDYGWFLSHNEDFSLYEHYRPNQEKYAEADQKNTGSVAVEIYNEEDVKDALASQGIPDGQIPVALEYTKAINGIPQQSEFRGDVIMIPSPKIFEEKYAASLKEKLKDNGISNSEEIVNALEVSTIERAKEYGIPENQIPDLMEATAEIAYRQKGFIPEEEWDLHLFGGGDTSGKQLIRYEFGREQYAAWIDHYTGLVPNRVSYGYLDTQSTTAQENAEELYAAGVIDEVDYSGPRDMLTYEGSFKHGGRYIAKLWRRYTKPNMPYEKTLALVGFAYNRGEDAPALLAAQYQLEEIGYPIETKNGIYTVETLATMKEYATDHHIDFDPEKIKKEIADRTFDIDSNSVFIAMKQKYKEVTGEEPAYAQEPVADGYVRSSSGAWDLMDICADLTPLLERCAVDIEQS